MAHLLGLVILIGVLDSLNPSTVAPALFFAAGRSAKRTLVGFIVGVLVVNLAGGLLLALGPGQAILALAPHPGFAVRRWLELSLGILVFLAAVVLWHQRRRLARHVSLRTDRIDRSSLLVGAGISAAELPTALPYFAVIAAVVGSGRAVSTQVAMLAIFNLVFVTPLLAVLVVRTILGERGRLEVERMRDRLDAHLATAIPALVLAVAVVLTARGASGLLLHHHHR